MDKTRLIIVGIVGTIIGVFIYNKYVEKRENDSKMKEIIEIRKEYRNQQKIETYSYLSDNQIAIAAQKYVEQYLKSPSTAKFPSLFKSEIKKTRPGSYIVTSYVDSQNGFGAITRNNYIVELNQTIDGKIILKDITFLK